MGRLGRKQKTLKTPILGVFLPLIKNISYDILITSISSIDKKGENHETTI